MDSGRQEVSCSGKASARASTAVDELQNTHSRSAAFAWLPALLVTVIITILMVVLVTSPQGTLQDKQQGKALNFVRVKQQEVVKTREFELEKTTPPQAPSMPAMEMASASRSAKTRKLPVKVVTVDSGTIKIDSELAAGFGLGSGIRVGKAQEAEFLPLVKFAPTYPQQALARGIEGHCVVRYTVTTEGTTRDVAVVEDECTHPVFIRPSIRSARNFRYQPRIIKGEAIEVHGVRNRFDYQLSRPR